MVPFAVTMLVKTFVMLLARKFMFVSHAANAPPVGAVVAVFTPVPPDAIGNAVNAAFTDELLNKYNGFQLVSAFVVLLTQVTCIHVLGAIRCNSVAVEIWMTSCWVVKFVNLNVNPSGNVVTSGKRIVCIAVPVT